MTLKNLTPKGKENLKWGFIGTLSVLALLGSIIALVATQIGYHKDSKTPLEWCVATIQNEEEYAFELAYTYKELQPKEYIEKEKLNEKDDAYAYVVVTYLEPYRTEWFCFFEGFHRSLFDRAAGATVYRPDEVVNVDCDIVYKINVEDEREIY